MDFKRYRCDGLSRRDLLHLGSITSLNLGLCGWMRGRAEAAQAPAATSCILIWLDGGPSHLDMFDPKPDAPREIRGPFGAIETSVPGVRIGEHLPKTARQMHHVALIRSLTHEFGNHDTGSSYLLTGRRPSTSVTYPSLGSLTARAAGNRSELPAYIAAPDPVAALGSGELPGSWRPFSIGGDPSKPGFQVRDLTPSGDVPVDRLRERLDIVRRLNEKTERPVHGDVALTRDRYYDQATDLVTGPAAQAAFDLSAEPQAVRDRYGRSRIGQCSLLARRLVERGVAFVSVVDRGWDTHQDIARELPDSRFPGSGKLPALDRAYSSLLADLAERGMLDTTLVVLMGEFGRTPKINSQGGRDHWPRAGFAALAGPVPAGVVVGATDAHGELPSERPVRPEDLAATLLTLLGLDPEGSYTSREGRPLRNVEGGAPVAELL